MSETTEVSVATIRWIIGGCFVGLGAIAKLEFLRLRKDIEENKMATEKNKMAIATSSVDSRITNLEKLVDNFFQAHREAKAERRDRDQKLFDMINEMNEKLHKHIESAYTKRDATSSQTLRKIFQEEIKQLRGE